jgi:hypothetical protein
MGYFRLSKNLEFFSNARHHPQKATGLLAGYLAAENLAICPPQKASIFMAG